MRLALLGRLRGDGGNHAAIWGDVRFCEGGVACARAASVDGDERRGHASGQGQDYGVRGGTRHNHKGSPCASFHPKLHVYLAADEKFADSGDCEGRDILSGAIISIIIDQFPQFPKEVSRPEQVTWVTHLVARKDSLRHAQPRFPLRITRSTFRLVHHQSLALDVSPPRQAAQGPGQSSAQQRSTHDEWR